METTLRHTSRLRVGGLAIALSALAVTMGGRMASAAGTDEADALFEEGRRLMNDGKLPEACAKLERSFQLAPRVGTMLNLGACHEKREQLAHAIALYERAATLAHQLGRTDRESAARAYATALEGRVGKLVVVVDEATPELVMQVDGESISTQSGLVPLDPGARKLTARAPGRIPFQTTVTMIAGKTTTVHIPKLATEETTPSPVREAPKSEGGSARTWLIAGGVGLAVVGAGLGTYFGLRAKSKHDESNLECDASGCSARGITLIDDAKSAGNLSTVAFAISGVALLGTVATIVVVRPSPPRQTADRDRSARRTDGLVLHVGLGTASFGGAF